MVRWSAAVELDDYSKFRRFRASVLYWNARLTDRHFSRRLTTPRQSPYRAPVMTTILTQDRITGQWTVSSYMSSTQASLIETTDPSGTNFVIMMSDGSGTGVSDVWGMANSHHELVAQNYWLPIIPSDRLEVYLPWIKYPAHTVHLVPWDPRPQTSCKFAGS